MKTMFTLTRRAALIGLAATALPVRAAESTPLRIEVPNLRNLQFFSLWIAMGAKLFEAEGLVPFILPAPQPRSVGGRLFTGEADIAVLPPPMYLGMMAEAKPVRLFASLFANDPINLVVRKEIAAVRKVPLQGSLKDKLGALKGLTLGVAGEPPPRLHALFAAAGMDAAKDVEIVIIHGPDQVAAFKERKVDVLFAHTPYLETVMVDEGAVLVIDTSGGEVAGLTGNQIHAFGAANIVVREKRDLLIKVTRAIARAQRMAHTDAAATVAALKASAAANVDPRQVEAIAAIYADAVPVNPRISIDGIRRAATLYPAHPRHPDFSIVNPADFVAADIAEVALKTL
ncbi:MAG: ABC transporter substrate-binding protein [Proteobacteria bacterium]|nr:ABC transporter substrate-binding protein [Pseudomonadota bacterium]